MNIIEFLEARIAEDEAAALAASKQKWRAKGWAIEYAQRVLAECAAKRAIIKLADLVESMDYQITREWGGDIDGTGEDILKALAAVYKDHPDYQQEWVA
ncbi:MAG: DUF6221 family protein [Gammaproteobacteria bacterium]